jgi:hypothetical protein
LQYHIQLGAKLSGFAHLLVLFSKHYDSFCWTKVVFLFQDEEQDVSLLELRLFVSSLISNTMAKTHWPYLPFHYFCLSLELLWNWNSIIYELKHHWKCFGPNGNISRQATQESTKHWLSDLDRVRNSGSGPEKRILNQLLETEFLQDKVHRGCVQISKVFVMKACIEELFTSVRLHHVKELRQILTAHPEIVNFQDENGGKLRRNISLN